MEVYGSGLEITLIISGERLNKKCRAVRQADRWFRHNLVYSTVHTKYATYAEVSCRVASGSILRFRNRVKFG